MSTSHMVEPFAVWGENNYCQPENHGKTTGINEYIVLNVPRTMFRRAASLFSDVRHTESSSRWDEITMQLFIQMIHETISIDESQKSKINVFPFVKAWLEWVPFSNSKETNNDNNNDESEYDSHKACCYRIHAVTLTSDVSFGNSLSRILSTASESHAESINRKMTSRKVDPMSGLQTYQKWMRLNGMEMYLRTICDRYSCSKKYTSQLDKILDPNVKLSGHNPANPVRVFDLDTALRLTPRDSNGVLLCDSRFADRNKYTYDDSVGEPVAMLKFPSQKHVRLLTPGEMHPQVFCGKYLPDHQHWMNIQKDLPSKTLKNDEEYDNTVENEYDIRTARDMERARLEGFADRSSFAELAQQSKIRYTKKCLPFEGTDEFPEKYTQYQEWAIHAFKHQCLDPEAHISSVVSKMITWREKNPNAGIIKHHIVDQTLSVFANRTLRLMEEYEQYCLISTAHRMMFLIMHARYDAFRRDFGLHFNCFQAGDGATSKSFLFDLMAKMSIGGTIEVLTYQTGKADAVDGNRNDITTVCHEAPPGMFRSAKNPNVDSTQEAMFKEKLTSQRVTAKIWCQDESTGKRTARLTKSECVGVWMGATNDPPSQVEEALKTRFFWGNFEKRQRRGRDIDDCMNGERMMSSEDKAHRNKFFLECKEEQYRVMVVEKAIWAGVIKDVNTTATNIVLPRMKNKMTKNSIICPGPRDWDRVKIFARNLAIVTAIERVCNLPGGKYFGKTFSEEALIYLEPHLCVTEEMVLFTLSLLSDQFRSPIEHKILNTIWNMEKNNPKFSGPDNQEDSVEYIKLDKLQGLPRKINSRMPLSNGKTSINNIFNFLLQMEKHSVKTEKYKMPTVVSGSTVRDNKFPVPSGGKQIVQSLTRTHEGVFIHVSHILAHNSDNDDNVFGILKSETHQNSKRKRLLTACPVSKNSFHILKVIDRKPGGNELHYGNVLANTSTSRWITGTSEEDAKSRTAGGYTIDRDIDEYTSEKWSKIIGKETFTPSEVIDNILEHQEYVRKDVRYPDMLMKIEGDSDSDIEISNIADSISCANVVSVGDVVGKKRNFKEVDFVSEFDVKKQKVFPQMNINNVMNSSNMTY